MATKHKLYGKILRGGEGASGRLSFMPTEPVRNLDDNEYLIGAEYGVNLDDNGYFSIELPATDDAAWSPAGWRWVCIMRIIDGTTQKFEFDLTAETKFASIAPVAEPAPA